MLSSLATEDQLLLEACRVQISPAGAARVARLLEHEVDWGYLLEASIRHAVSPLLKHGLARIAELEDVEGRIPEVFVRDLEQIYAASARRNATIFAALKEVVAALRASGVEPVGLKDVQLAVAVYPEPALRPMGDIDLLVRRQDWDAAATCLASLGFLPRPDGDVPYMRKYDSPQHFRRAEDELWIDLQSVVMQREWDLYGEGSFTYDSEAMWRNAVPIPGLDFELRAPALEDMLFHLCLHLEGHRYGELVLFCDIAELLRRQGDAVDWKAVGDLARAYRSESSLYYVLLLSQRLLEASVPDEVLDSLAPAFWRAGVYMPLFGNLTPLHHTLDDIRASVRPPGDVMLDYERIVRRQVARAMRLDLELTRLVEAFLDEGGALAIVLGSVSPRILPDAALPAFEPLRLLIRDADRPLLERALAARGFEDDASNRRHSKSVDISSEDPVLSRATTGLKVEIEWSSDLGRLSGPVGGEASNAGSAFKSLGKRLSGAVPSDGDVSAELVVFALPPEQLAVGLAADVGRAQEDRLFRVCSLLELLRRLPTSLDVASLHSLASQHGVGREVARGFAVAAAVDDRATPGSGMHPRVLEWARYGPESVNRYPWLRPAYYLALSLSARLGFRARLAYLGRAIVGGGGGRPVLPSILLGAAGGAVRSIVRRKGSLRDFAYWIDPATAGSLTSVRDLASSAGEHDEERAARD